MSTLLIARQGVYWTIQGEGVFSGEPMLFLRLARCSTIHRMSELERMLVQ